MCTQPIKQHVPRAVHLSANTAWCQESMLSVTQGGGVSTSALLVSERIIAIVHEHALYRGWRHDQGHVIAVQVRVSCLRWPPIASALLVRLCQCGCDCLACTHHCKYNNHAVNATIASRTVHMSSAVQPPVCCPDRSCFCAVCHSLR